MQRLLHSLLVAERLDLASALARCAQSLPWLARMAEFRCGKRSLLERTQAVMDAVLAALPPPAQERGERVTAPWWSPMPAVYVAALFQHVGLPEVSPSGRSPEPLAVPHWRDSACLAREAMRALGMPFEVREHAVALILHQRDATRLVSSGALPQAYRALACVLDLRALYWLRRAELEAVGGPEDTGKRLDVFVARARELGAFGCVPRPPLPPAEAEALGFAEPRQLHRALNALRYFDIIGGMRELQWHRERLRLERRNPSGRLHLLVGPAGTGKSTWAESHFPPACIVSSDRMREELTGDPADQSQNYLVFQRSMDRIRDMLERGREVVFDATNCSETLRSMPVQAARWTGAEIVSYFFDVSLEQALDRNARRARQVPEHVIRRQYRALEVPALYEADRHAVVGADGCVRIYWPPETQE